MALDAAEFEDAVRRLASPVAEVLDRKKEAFTRRNAMPGVAYMVTYAQSVGRTDVVERGFELARLARLQMWDTKDPSELMAVKQFYATVGTSKEIDGKELLKQHLTHTEIKDLDIWLRMKFGADFVDNLLGDLAQRIQQ